MDIEVSPRNIGDGASSADDGLNNARIDIDHNELLPIIEPNEAMETNSSPASSDECEMEKDTCDNSHHLPNGILNKDDSGDESIEYADAVDEEGACFFSLAPELVEDQVEQDAGKYRTV